MQRRKVALVTGITGQDGGYLAELLLGKGYEVHGLRRPASLHNTDRIDRFFSENAENAGRLQLHYGDLTDGAQLVRLVQKIQPDEIYNLGAQSHVAISFEQPEYTANVDGLGTLRLLEAIRICGLEAKTRFYQASTSELFGQARETPQVETTPFHPRSPYAVAKLYAYWITVNYREAYGLYACNGILFNHESPTRGEGFVARKITRALARIAAGRQDSLKLGNLSALRDWGHARDYVEMQWLMLQQAEPQDYVVATGIQYSVREFVQMTAEALGLKLRFEGEGLDERGVVAAVSGRDLACRPGDVIVRVDPSHFRAAEVEALLGDPGKAKRELGWSPRTSVPELIREMVEADLAAARRDALVETHGFSAYAGHA